MSNNFNIISNIGDVNLVADIEGGTQAEGEYFGGERDEVTGEWRKLHNEEFNDLY